MRVGGEGASGSVAGHMRDCSRAERVHRVAQDGATPSVRCAGQGVSPVGRRGGRSA